MTIEIEALDTLFFRDGKPFSMGDDTWANGMFPPLPSVLYGALRTAYMAQKNIPINDIIGKTENLRIKQIFYKIKTDGQVGGLNYLPMPLDLVSETEPEKHISDKEKIKWKKKKKEDEQDVFSNSCAENSFPSHLSILPIKKQNILTYNKDIEVESFEDGVITDTSFKEYIESAKEFQARKLVNSYCIESKMGIGRQNETRTTEEGKLYRVNMLRPNDIKICIEFEGLDDFEEKGLLRLGAENKLATFEKISIEKLSIPQNFELETEFKIYLSTPAIFDNGYYPTQIFKNAKVEEELLTCAVGKYLNVGGFDMKERKPKPMQKAVPAGSVYYYRLKSGNLQDLLNKLQTNGISEFRQKEGFGIAYIAKI